MTIITIIEDVKKLLDNFDIKKMNEKTILLIANDMINTLKVKYKKIDYSLVLLVLKNILKPKYKISTKEHDLKCYREYENFLPELVIPKEYLNLEKQFQRLKNLPQPEQRTKEWFDYRFNRITASDTAAAIDLNPYEPVEGFILKKCDPDFKFLDNENVYHGKKYEPIATSIYEYIYNNKVIEFGALPSDKHDFLGASPDGICSAKTLDNKFSNLLGRMLEIKCVVRRHIYTSGKIKGEICPFYYYCQVQQQLECCDLDQCDFWQCNIIEYKDRESYLLDECKNTKHTEGTDAKSYDINPLIKKGIILKFLPKVFVPEFKDDSAEWKSKFIYPLRLDIDEKEYDEWVINKLSNWQVDYPDIAETHYYEKMVYWKLESSHNVVVERDKQFFSNILPILKDTWEKVRYYREHLDELDKLKIIVKNRTKYIKFNTDITINDDLIDKKIDFLYDNVESYLFSPDQKLKLPYENKNIIKKCDFLD